MSNDPLEDLLRSTASETRTALGAPGQNELPPFEPNSNRGGVIVAALIALIVVGVGGWLVGSMSDSPVEVETADPDVIEEPETPDQPDGIEEDGSAPTTAEEVAPVPSDLDERVQSNDARPAFGESFTDDAFGSVITRVTNAANGERIIPVQSPAALWNADESLMLLYQTGLDVSGHIVVDATNFAVELVLPILPTDIEHVFWHPTDPDLIVTTVDLELVTFSVSTGEVTTIASYPQCDFVDPGVATAGPSRDGSVIALRCGMGGDIQVLSQPLDGTPAAMLDVGNGNQGMASADGQSIIIDRSDGFDVYNTDLTELRSTIDWAASAPTVGVDGDGNSIIVSAGFESDFPGSLVIAGLDGGLTNDGSAVEVIVGPDTGFIFPPSGTTIFASGLPGLLAASSPVPPDRQDGGTLDALEGEVVLADLRTSPPTIQRLAQSRNFGDGPFSNSFVSISPSGRFVAFASDWGGDASDTYVIDLEG